MRNFLTIMPLRTAVAQQMPDSAVVHTVAADSTKVFGKGLHDIVGDLAQDSPKFWVIQDIWEWLRHIGMGPSWTNVLAFMITAAAMAVVIWLLDVVVRNIAMRYIKSAVDRSKNIIDNFMYSRGFFQRVFNILTLLLVLFSVKTFFKGFNSTGINCVCYIAFRQCFSQCFQRLVRCPSRSADR